MRRTGSDRGWNATKKSWVKSGRPSIVSTVRVAPDHSCKRTWATALATMPASPSTAGVSRSCSSMGPVSMPQGASGAILGRPRMKARHIIG